MPHPFIDFLLRGFYRQDNHTSSCYFRLYAIQQYGLIILVAVMTEASLFETNTQRLLSLGMHLRVRDAALCHIALDKSRNSVAFL